MSSSAPAGVCKAAMRQPTPYTHIAWLVVCPCLLHCNDTQRKAILRKALICELTTGCLSYICPDSHGAYNVTMASCSAFWVGDPLLAWADMVLTRKRSSTWTFFVIPCRLPKLSIVALIRAFVSLSSLPILIAISDRVLLFFLYLCVVRVCVCVSDIPICCFLRHKAIYLFSQTNPATLCCEVLHYFSYKKQRVFHDPVLPCCRSTI